MKLNKLAAAAAMMVGAAFWIGAAMVAFGGSEPTAPAAHGLGGTVVRVSPESYAPAMDADTASVIAMKFATMVARKEFCGGPRPDADMRQAFRRAEMLHPERTQRAITLAADAFAAAWNAGLRTEACKP